MAYFRETQSLARNPFAWMLAVATVVIAAVHLQDGRTFLVGSAQPRQLTSAFQEKLEAGS